MMKQLRRAVRERRQCRKQWVAERVRAAVALDELNTLYRLHPLLPLSLMSAAGWGAGRSGKAHMPPASALAPAARWGWTIAQTMLH